MKEQYIVIHYYHSLEFDGGIEVDYYDTEEEARKYAVKGDTLTKLIEEIE